MKRFLFQFFAAVLLSALCGCANSGFMALSISGKNDGGIYHINSGGEIIHTALPKINYMIKSPRTGLYYATQNGIPKSRNRFGNVIVMQKNSDGTMNILQTVSVQGITPCHLTLSPCGKFLYTANYSSGNISEFRIDQGKLISPPRLIQHHGSSVSKRQTAPHPHFTGFDPQSKELFVCDLGTDEVVIYTLTLTGAEPVSKLKLSPGAGPRHLAFAPDGKTIYVANELDSTVTSFIKTSSAWKKMKTLSSRPASPAAKKNFPGAIKITSCGKYFFVTNRGDDTIAMFAALPDGDFKLCRHVSAQGAYPSDILLPDNEKTLLTVNLKSGNVTSFQLDKTAGKLIPRKTAAAIPRGIGLCE